MIEAAITYEPGTGAVEIVANQRQNREELAAIFSSELLQTGPANKRLPLRRFDLQSLATRRDFPTDPSDGIEAVKLNLLRLMPLNSPAERLTIECMRSANTDIWAMADRNFGPHNPLSGGWRVTQARMAIRFHAKPGSGRGRTLPLTITMPHGCDLKDRTEDERLIGSKYLARWGLAQG